MNGQGIRVINAVALLALVVISCSVLAADEPANTPPLDDTSRLELRGGYLVSIPFPFLPQHAFPERGTSNLNIEVVAPKFWHTSSILDVLLPRLHAGGTANLDGRTSYAYAGFLWTVDYTPRNFAELFFGGVVHDGQVGDSNPKLAQLGCHALYQIGVNFGYRLSSRLSAMLTFDHASDGEPFLSSCDRNEGIDVLGLRLGYAF